jgi:hypothetical protein
MRLPVVENSSGFGPREAALQERGSSGLIESFPGFEPAEGAGVGPGARGARIKVLYIAGWQRSGSTLLANILGQITGFFSTGELYYLWDYVWARNVLCGCGRRIRECPVWGDVLLRAFGGADRVDIPELRKLGHLVGATRRLPALVLPATRKRVATRLAPYLEHLARLYAAIGSSTGTRVVVDSSKWPSYGRVLEMVDGLDVRVVHLVRDPRAVAHSWLRRKLLPDRDPPEEAYRSPLDSSLRWDAWNLATEIFWPRGSGRRLLLRYEDFVAEPRAAVRAILRFADEATDALPFVSERTVELGVTHTVSGNPMRLTSGRTEIAPDDEWSRAMGTGSKALVGLVTFPLLWSYGYGLGRARAETHRPLTQDRA